MFHIPVLKYWFKYRVLSSEVKSASGEKDSVGSRSQCKQ